MAIRVMGIDASTTTIGLALVEFDTKPKLIEHDFIKPPKKGTIFSKLLDVKNEIRTKVKLWKPDEVAIEDIIQFMKGGSGAKTIIPLAVINRTVGLVLYEEFNIEPHLMNVLSIRHALKKDKKLPAKEEIPDLVADHLGIKYPWRYKIHRRTKQQVIMVESFDIADSIAVALAHIKKTK